eukprot:CAMPEP_0117420980 /NCGR_PEP_ID=MMETSP0758-20121206/2194_1 /TAXON_ID=63605 /ORGANISM="Percolomonas cosmopolitus, Strain AE-1 (ATCC 50343)" /LENGTH=497 /DNA_ID=CAMNT_0005202891 /DNA_START=261 /DNA_END=1754 /DNA_ORIENTATION=-
MWTRDKERSTEAFGEKKQDTDAFNNILVQDEEGNDIKIAEGKESFYSGTFGQNEDRFQKEVLSYEATFEAHDKFFKIHPEYSSDRKYLKYKIDSDDNYYYIPYTKNTIDQQENFSFLSYGDMDINSNAECTISSIKKTMEHEDTSNLQFIIHQGDLGYAYWGDENRWNEWFSEISTITAKYPYMVSPGNHEFDEQFKAYQKHFSLIAGNESESQSNLYYSWNFANIHFVALSTEHLKDDRQKKWLIQDLKKVDTQKQPFTIAYLHRPMYSSNRNHGGHSQTQIYFESIFVDHHVDLVLNGHVHAYERTCPINKGKCVDHGPIHVVAGTAGYNSNEMWEESTPKWSLKRNSNHGYLQLFMDQKKKQLTIQFLENNRVYPGCNPSIFDQFVISPHPEKLKVEKKPPKDTVKEEHGKMSASKKEQLYTVLWILFLIFLVFIAAIIFMITLFTCELRKYNETRPDREGYTEVEQVELDSEEEEHLMNDNLDQLDILVDDDE